MPAAPRYRFGDFEIAAGERVLRRGGDEVALPRKATALLLELLAQPGAILGKEELLRRVWPDVVVDDNNLDQAVGALRRALGDRAAAPRYLETVARHGYRFVAPVTLGQADGGERAGRPAERVLAVLPFRAPGADDALASLAAGLAEALISRLSRVAGLTLRSASAVARFDAAERDARAIGAELDADLVVDGSLRRHGDRLRARVELVRVDGAAVLWADGVDERLDDLFVLEDRLTARLAEALQARLSAGAAARPVRDVQAYQLYLLGRHLASRLTAESYRAGRECFETALARDPGYALAWAGLAFAHLNAVDLFAAPAEAMPAARVAAERALALDPDLAEAHACLAGVRYWWDWDWAGTEAACRRALELAPGLASTRRLYAWFLLWEGRTQESLALVAEAASSDPYSLENHLFESCAHYFARRYPAALEIAGRALASYPDLWLMRVISGRVHEALGDLERARADFELALPSGGAEVLGDLGRVRALAGDRAGARAALAELETLARTAWVSPFNRAVVHLGLGELDPALDALEAAVDARSWYASWLGVAPLLDPLAGQPRYRALIERTTGGRGKPPSP